MRIQVTRFSDVTEIEGDEAKLSEMISIHGAANVANLDAEIVEIDYPEPDIPVLVDPVSNSSEPVLPEPVVEAPAEPVEVPAQV